MDNGSPEATILHGRGWQTVDSIVVVPNLVQPSARTAALKKVPASLLTVEVGGGTTQWMGERVGNTYVFK